MIKLTLTNNIEILINTEQISKIEHVEPTRIIFDNGTDIEVKETAMTITNLIQAISYRKNNTLNDIQKPE